VARTRQYEETRIAMPLVLTGHLTHFLACVLLGGKPHPQVPPESTAPGCRDEGGYGAHHSADLGEAERSEGRDPVRTAQMMPIGALVDSPPPEQRRGNDRLHGGVLVTSGASRGMTLPRLRRQHRNYPYAEAICVTARSSGETLPGIPLSLSASARGM